MENPESKKEILEKIRTTGDVFDRFANLSPELLDFRPDLEDAWTIRENLIHALDSEMGLFLRIRQAVANPGSDAVQAFDLEDWRTRFDHTGQSIADTITAYRMVHGLAYQVLSHLEEKDWDASFINHFARGKQTLRDVAKIVSYHGGFHVELIERNETIWKEQS